MAGLTIKSLPATEIGKVEPGSAEWLRYMSGSKIAAVLGLSAYESPFSLYFRMLGAVPSQDWSDQTRRGHYLEPAIRSWFADQRPEWTVRRTGMWVSNLRARHAVSPDGLIRAGRGDLRLFEAKSAARDEEWGTPGTDEIPIGYRCQVLWGMDVLGLRVAHVAVLKSYLEFAEYVVEYDEVDALLLREQADAFLARLDSGERPPIDGHDATYQVVRELAPGIDPVQVPVPEELARSFCEAKHAEKVAATEAKRQTALLAEFMGEAQTATYGGRRIASRMSKKGGVPYVIAAQGLPFGIEQKTLGASA